MTTDSLKAALKPCPFCGGEAERFTIEEEGDNFGGDVICCKKCGASSHVEFGRKENLVDCWNRRASTDAAPVAEGHLMALPDVNRLRRLAGPPSFHDLQTAVRAIMALYAHPPVPDAAGEGVTVHLHHYEMQNLQRLADRCGNLAENVPKAGESDKNWRDRQDTLRQAQAWINVILRAALAQPPVPDAAGDDRYLAGYSEGSATASQQHVWVQDKAWQDAVLMLVHYRTLAARTWLVGHEDAQAKLDLWWERAAALSQTKTAEDIAALAQPPAAEPVLEAALNQNDAMRQELAHIGNLVSDLERAMSVDPANGDGSWPDLAGRITKLKEAARNKSAAEPVGEPFAYMLRDSEGTVLWDECCIWKDRESAQAVANEDEDGITYTVFGVYEGPAPAAEPVGMREAIERFLADYDDGDRADAGIHPLMEAHIADFRALATGNGGEGRS